MCNVIHTPKKRFTAVFLVSKLCYEKRRFCKRVEKRFFKRALNIATNNRTFLCLWAFLVKGVFLPSFPELFKRFTKVYLIFLLTISYLCVCERNITLQSFKRYCCVRSFTR